MNDTDTTYIAFTEAKQAEYIDGVFGGIGQSFEIYMDERLHSAPEESTSPYEAGSNDAKMTPPQPRSYSLSPEAKNYLFKLNVIAGDFLMELLGICKARFKWIKSRLEDLKLDEPLPENTVKTSDLEAAVNSFNDEIEDTENFVRKFLKDDDYQLLEPSRSSPLMFVAIVFLIGVSEFGCLWFFLSDQLGLATAIYASMVATTLVVVIAALSALSLAITTADMSLMMRNIGYCSFLLCVLMFLFGIGLLSGLRADSTNEGMDLIIEGYQSMTKLDVFVTALINLGGFILLTLKFKPFFWPYPLYGYGGRVKKRAELKAKITGEKENLHRKLENARVAVNENKKVVTQHKRSMKEFEQGKLGKKISSVKKSVEDQVDLFRGRYISRNEIIRNDGPYDVSSDGHSNKGSLFDDEKINHEIDEIEDLIEGLNKNKFYESIDNYLIMINKDEDKLNELYREIDDITSRMKRVKQTSSEN